MTTDGSRITTGYDIIHHIVVVYLYTAFPYWFKIKGWLSPSNCLYSWDGHAFFFFKINVILNRIFEY